MSAEGEQASRISEDKIENGITKENEGRNQIPMNSNGMLHEEESSDKLVQLKSKYRATKEEIDALKSQGLVNLIGRDDNATGKIVFNSMEDLLWRLTAEKEKEKVSLQLLSDSRDRHMALRMELHKKTQLKYAKEQELERLDWSLRQKIARIEELQNFVNEVKEKERRGSPYANQIEEVEKKLDAAYELGNRRRKALIKACRRHDHLDMLISRAEEHESKLKATVADLKRKIEHAQERRKRIKENALRSIANAKNYFERCIETETNNKRLSEKLRKVEIRVFELEEKVNKREDALREIQMELKFRKLDLERAQTELMIKKSKE